MKTEKMKGGIFEWPFLTAALVFALVFVFVLTIGFFIRSATIGPSIQITTYTEYRWMSYFPSASLFYLTYPVENWIALNEIAKTYSEETQVWSRSEFVSKFSSEGIDLIKFNELMRALEEKMKKEKHSFVIKDKKGLIISLGLPEDYLNLTKWVSFPEAYPYNCQYKDTPIFSREVDNMRIKFVLCCQDIFDCGNYLTAPGRDECPKDPCGVGPCKFHYCGSEKSQEAKEFCLGKKKGTRICIYNEPPKLNFFAKFEDEFEWKTAITRSFTGEDKVVNFRLEVEKDFKVSNISKIILDFGDESSDAFVPKENPDGLRQEWNPTNAIFWFDHTYKKPGDYTVICTVRDEDKNENKEKVVVSLI